MKDGDAPNEPALAPTSWALLCMLSCHPELSGYDIRKYIKWNLSYFYESPSRSQIYTDLKKFEQLGLATSRVESSGARSRRLYQITDAGRDAVVRWANDAPVELPTLKNSVLLRVSFGHLSDPGRLREILEEHVAHNTAMMRSAANDAKWAEADPAWAYARLALRWAHRHYDNERELARQMLEELDEAESTIARAARSGDRTITWPTTEYWYEIEKRANADDER
ncbi:helix-turn-helix transcriptional regulator [Mycolicibacterium vaccae]|uniref:helix-turn-helix transcriptional regulator n=1 Tax=Mycolicibacterium vaccae TaxID=1810 RepID=UPI003CF1905C